MESASDLPTLQGERVALRALDRADAHALLEMLSEPAIERWWGAYDRARLEREFFDSAGTHTYVVEFRGTFAGVILFDEVDDPDYRSAGIDITLSIAYQNLGLGTDALRTLICHLIEVRGHHRVTIDPATDNVRAIHVYEKVGFKPVGVMRRYERGADGQWHDGLLMDLLADEFDA